MAWMRMLGLLMLAASAACVEPQAAAYGEPEEPPAVAAAEAPRIHIVHEVVRIDVTPAVAAPPAPIRKTSLPSKPHVVTVARAARDQAPRPAGAARDGILVRAGRALTGDGRHRPEPFPTPK